MRGGGAHLHKGHNGDNPWLHPPLPLHHCPERALHHPVLSRTPPNHLRLEQAADDRPPPIDDVHRRRLGGRHLQELVGAVQGVPEVRRSGTAGTSQSTTTSTSTSNPSCCSCRCSCRYSSRCSCRCSCGCPSSAPAGTGTGRGSTSN